MAQTGVRGIYLILEQLKSLLLSDDNVNTVTTGDITEVALDKKTIYPLSHIILNNVTSEENILTFNVSVLSMDIVDENKDEVTDKFVGNNNEQDILNTQLAVLNKVIQKMRIGSIHLDGYQVNNTASLEPFFDRFEDRVAGWTATFDIAIMNDIDIC